MTHLVQIDGAKKIPGAKICAYTRSGGRWVLRHKFPSRDCKQLFDTLAAIREKGQIDLAYWRAPYKGEI
jgi:hypothetical protein